MKRRAFLISAGVAAAAGCSSSSDTSDSNTEETTPTGTPEPELTIEATNLVSHWESYDDVLSNEMASVGQGGYANVGVRYNIPVHDGEVEETVQATIYKDGSSVNSWKNEDQRLVNDQSYEGRELVDFFETEGWEKGTYEAEVIVRDEISGQNSEEKRFEFDVVEPLGQSEVTLESVGTPPDIETGENFSFTLDLANDSERDSSIVTPFSARYENREWTEDDETFLLNLPAGETRSWESNEISLDTEGTYEYRLDNIEINWTITVTE